MTGRIRVVFADDTPPEGLDSSAEDGSDDAGGIDGAVTTVVGSARDCLEALPSADCVVVADLPETDPVDLCERIRDRRPDVPIVAFPADGSEALAGELVAAGIDGYVPRSEGMDALSGRIRDVTSSGSSRSNDDREATDSEPADDRTRESPVARTNTIEALESAVVLDPDYGGGAGALSASTADSGAERPTDDTDSARVNETIDRFFGGIPLAVVEWNREFEAVGWSAAATGLFGYSAEEALGTSAFELLIHESERDSAREYWSELVDSQYGRGPSTRINRNVRADGSVIVCEWVNTPVFDGDEVVGVLSYARDVSEEHKRANALEALQETTHELIRAESAERIAEIVMDATETVLDQPLGAIRFYDEETGRLELEAATSELASVAADAPPVDPEQTDFWKAYDDGESIVVTDVSTETVPVEFEPDADVSMGNAILHPIGEHGLLAIASTGEDRLDPTDIHLVRVLAATVEAALDRTVRTRELARTETIVEAVGDGVYALDADGRFVTVNDRLTAVTGYARDDLLGAHVSTILSDESDARRRKRVRALSRVGEDGIATYEAALETSDGETVPCEINTTLWRPEDGDGDGPGSDSDADRTGTVGIVRDVTDRKRMQREIIDQKAKIESLHAVASRLDDCDDRDEVCQLAVEAAEDVLNFDACAVYLADQDDDSLVKKAISSAFDDQYDRRIPLDRGIAGKTYRNERTYRIEDVGARDDARPATEAFRSALSVPIGDRGVFQAASTEYEAFDDDDKELAELLLSHVSDALERLAFEEVLRTERDRFAALFENVPDAVISSRYVDEEPLPVVEAVNPAFERVFGYDESELIGESIDDYIVPSDREEEAERINRAGSHGDTVEKEVKRRTTDGLRDFMLRLAPMRTDGYSERTFGVYTDITERKQHRKRVEILNRVLRHDLRNGMNIIDGCAQLLLEELEALENDPDADLDVDGREYARTIRERANELIDLAEKTRGVERTLEREDSAAGRIDLADLVSDAVGRLEREYPRADVTTSVPDSCGARGTEFLETALFQVLENAVEHNDTERPSIEVTISDASEDGMVRVSIADDGPGIPAEERELLQEDREITQLRHASGLGLWLVNWVVTHSGGRLSFSENGSRGAVVTIELPRAEFDGDDDNGNGERDRGLGRGRGRDREPETDPGT